MVGEDASKPAWSISLSTIPYRLRIMGEGVFVAKAREAFIYCIGRTWCIRRHVEK